MAQAPLNPNSTNDQQSMQALKQYGGYIIGTILLALAAYFGWTYWQNHQSRVDTVAADAYANIQQSSDEVNLLAQNPDLDDAGKQQLQSSQAQLSGDIDALVSKHGYTVYAWQALMIKARQQVDAQDYDAASTTLKDAVDIALPDDGLHAITVLRYAQVLLGKGDADAAMQAISVKLPSSFEASKQELLGDIALAKGDQQAAIRAYNNAWQQLQERQENRAVLVLKMESMGISPEPMKAQASLIAMPTVSAAPVQVTDSAEQAMSAEQPE